MEETLQALIQEVRESRAFGELSSDEIRTRVSKALCEAKKAADPEGYFYCYVCEVFPSFVIARGDGEGYSKVPYTYSESAGLKLGDPTPVEHSWIPALVAERASMAAAMETQKARESQEAAAQKMCETCGKASAKEGMGTCEGCSSKMREARTIRATESKPTQEALDCTARESRFTEAVTSFSEAQFDKEGVVEGVVPIRPGLSKNRRLYPPSVLRRDVSVFEGMPVFYDHQNPKEPKELKNLLGVLENARWDSTNNVPRADLRYQPSAKGAIQDIRDKLELLGHDRVGLSIDMDVKAKVQQVEGKVVQSVEALLGGFDASTDVVFMPSAGGGFDRAFEATAKETEMLEGLEKLTLDELKAARPDLFTAQEAQVGKETPVVETKPEVDIEARVNEALNSRMVLIEKRAKFAARVAESKVPEKIKNQMLAEADAASYDVAACETIYKDWVDTAAQTAGGPQVQVPGGNVQVTEGFDYCHAALLGAAMNQDQQLNGNRVPRFNSLRQAICAFDPAMQAMAFNQPHSFAREAMGMLHWKGGELFDVKRGREAITSTTFDQAWADVMHRMVMREIADPDLNTWREWVSDYANVPDLTNSYKFIRFGDYGTLSSVAEGGTYQPLSTPADEQETVTAGKYGNTETYTWESALRDDLRGLARIPQALGRAWAWTRHDFIYTTVLQANTGTGQTLNADSTVLYHANHSNIATAAFTAADLITVEDKIRAQTALSSGKAKKYLPRFLLYQRNATLRQGVWEALNSSYKVTPLGTSNSHNNLPSFIKEVLGLEAIEVYYPTSTSTRWEVIADPREAQTAAVAFLHGREEPELWVQDMDRVGSVFTADQITYKIRGTVGATALDYRSFSRGNL